MNRFREPVSGFTHLAGALLSAIGLVWLVALTHDDPDKLVSMLVYGFSLIALYSASTVLHLTHGSQRLLNWLRSFDHATIYLLIAGTYTPICYNILSGSWRWGLLSAVWALAEMGIAYKLLFRRRDHSTISTLFYLGMGWMSVIAAPLAIPLLPAGALLLILGGGLLYSVGAVIFAVRRPNFHPYFGFHEVWHLFTMGGSALHFAAIVLYVA